MPVYHYHALNPAGKTVKGILTADDRSSALEELQAKGLFPRTVKETDSCTVSSSRLRLRLPSGTLRSSGKERAAAFRQLSTLLEAGISLEDALSDIISHSAPALRTVYARILEDIRGGTTLADAFAKHPKLFSPECIATVSAGEHSGQLALVISQLADFSEQRLKLRKKLLSSLIYPFALLVVAIGAVLFLVSYVVPQVTHIFDSMNAQLPLPTKLLIAASNGVQTWWLAGLLVTAALSFALKQYSRTPQGATMLADLALRMPLLGTLLRKHIIARFTRTAGILIENGVPLLQVLTIAGAATGHPRYQQAVTEAASKVRDGAPLASSLAQAGLLPGSLERMIAAGERGGELGSMFRRSADITEQELESGLNLLVSLAEPCIILLMGFLVGFVVLAIMLPILEMNTLF